MVIQVAAPVLAVIALIAIVSGVTFVTAYRRDIKTAQSDENIELSEDDTISEILDSDDLTDSQKAALLKQYIAQNNETTTGSTDIEKYFPYIIVGIFALLLLKG